MSRILETILPESIRNEGLLFVPQVLEDLMRGKLDREFPVRLDEGEDPASARTYAFDVARRLYKTFSDSLTQANYKVVTRKFVVNLLDNALGWNFDKTAALNYTDRPFLVEPLDQAVLEDESNNQTLQTIRQFPVVFCPHLCTLDETNIRFHGWGLSTASRSATRFAQEFLNSRDEYLWALVTNGKELRLVRDNPSLTRPCFLSFDLGAILGGAGDFAAFAFMWRLLHASRIDVTASTSTSDLDLSAQRSFWESLHARSAETGVRALTGLRSGVVAAIEALGTGFLRLNPEIRDALQEGTLTVQDYEQELLRLAYRFLFLFVAEERRLLHTPGTSEAVKKVYREGYSMARLRRIAARYAAGSSDRHTDLYTGVSKVFAALAHGEPRLGLTALGGIFEPAACERLNDAKLANADLIAAMRALRYIDAGKKLFPVNYRDMGAEEFGSVYEGILELVPNYTAATQTLTLVGAAGNNRKTTGSYYTPSSLVDKQVESALDPLIERCGTAPDPEKALLELNVIDTSCGSGHFTVAAARRMATALVQMRGNDSSPEAYQHALRDVISHCIYGVDINPLAVELAKITLWIESVVPGQPLSFLDAHFVCGDATLGLDNLKLLEGGIPAAAYKPLPGDDKAICQELAKKNRAELKQLEKDRKSGQLVLGASTDDLARAFERLAAMPETTLADVEAKRAAYAGLLASRSANHLVQAANLFTAAFLLKKGVSVTHTTYAPTVDTTSPAHPLETVSCDVPTTTNILSLLTGSLAHESPTPEMLLAAEHACRRARVLHWPLVFPEVFQKGGFDCILTNPPWDQMQFSEEEYFASRDARIANLAGDARKRAIAVLRVDNPLLWEAYTSNVSHLSHTTAFINHSGRFPLSSIGKLNLYSVITETALTLVSDQGRLGIIIPSGICTDDSNKKLFDHIIRNHKIVSLYDFENSISGAKIFDAIHPQFHFSLVTFAQSHTIDFAFFLGGISDLVDDRRHYSLVDGDLELINPNTRTAPGFNSAQDASLAKKIYCRTGVFCDEVHEGRNVWGASVRKGLFNMTTDDRLLENSSSGADYPLYEGKLVGAYDHRSATFEVDGKLRSVSDVEKKDCSYEIMPRKWASVEIVHKRLGAWRQPYLLGWHDIARATDQRTCVAAVFPIAAVSDTLQLFFTTQTANLNACLLGDMNSLVHDWCARQKIVGAHLNGFVGKQIATLAPTAYTQADIDYIVPRVLELTYTSHSLKGWAEALGYEGEPFVFDPERRAVLRAELDARYAKLYGLNEQELTYILDPSAVYGPDYPSESFRVLKEKEIAEFGEYRTMRMVLSAWREQELNATDEYMRHAQPFAETDVHRDYLKFLIRQMLRETEADQLPLSELYSAWAALEDPERMASLDGMPAVVKSWAVQFKDAIREDESLEEILIDMCADKQISISRKGLVSLRNFPLDETQQIVRDISMDARLALAYCRKIMNVADRIAFKTRLAQAFLDAVTRGEYELAA